MKHAAVFLVLAVCLGVGGALGRVTSTPHRSALHTGLTARGIHQQSIDSDEKWFIQTLDHFDPRNEATWSQRYFVNSTYYVPGSPVFLLLGGEGPASPIDVGGHFVINEYAQKFQALIVSIEHRFYGKSIPTHDLSNGNLRYLTSEQALADFATFVQENAGALGLPNNTKWISFGGSYSGSLSAWFRLKYPHLVDGALATSGPLRAHLEFSEYNQVVQRSLDFFAGPACAERIKAGTDAATNLVGSAEGRKKLQGMFSLCTPMETKEDIALFFENMEGTVAQIVQYNNDNNNYNHGLNINKMCDVFTKGSDPLAAYAEFNALYNRLFETNCTQTKYEDYVRELRDVRPYPANENAAGRAWTYQTCTEFGWYQTGSAPNQPFSPAADLDWFLKQCRDMFGLVPGPRMPGIGWTNLNYGSTGLADPKVILPNGSIDPWHAMGLLPEVAKGHPGQLAMLINGTAHCADLYPSSPSDVQGLKDARTQIVAAIQRFLR